MIHFKAIRASRLLLAIGIIALVSVLVVLGIRLALDQREPTTFGSASLVNADGTDEARTEVFASSDSLSKATVEPAKGGIEIEILSRATETPPPRILIYHTHTHEAYEQEANDPYEAVEAWRTTDNDHSVVRVGKELARQLRKSGFDVVHDTTDHEGNALSTAYTRSLLTLQGYGQAFDLYIDLHRDAYVEGEALAVSAGNGGKMAPLMVLIGNGNGFEEKPYYNQNLAFARALERRVNAIVPGLCKPVMVKDGRYNQHIGVFAILVEVGHNRNTLSQALNTTTPLAQALTALLLEDPDPELEKMQAEYRQSIAAHSE